MIGNLSINCRTSELLVMDFQTRVVANYARIPGRSSNGLAA